MPLLTEVELIHHPLLQPQPVLQVSKDFEWISDKCRAEMNAWLLEMFGKQDIVYLVNKAVFRRGKLPSLFSLDGNYFNHGKPGPNILWWGIDPAFEGDCSVVAFTSRKLER